MFSFFLTSIQFSFYVYNTKQIYDTNSSIINKDLLYLALPIRATSMVCLYNWMNDRRSTQFYDYAMNTNYEHALMTDLTRSDYQNIESSIYATIIDADDSDYATINDTICTDYAMNANYASIMDPDTNYATINDSICAQIDSKDARVPRDNGKVDDALEIMFGYYAVAGLTTLHSFDDGIPILATWVPASHSKEDCVLANHGNLGVTFALDDRAENAQSFEQARQTRCSDISYELAQPTIPLEVVRKCKHSCIGYYDLNVLVCRENTINLLAITDGKLVPMTTSDLAMKDDSMISVYFDFIDAMSVHFGDKNVASFGDMDITSFGDMNVASFDYANVASFGCANILSFDDANISSFGHENVDGFDCANVASFDDASFACFGRSDNACFGDMSFAYFDHSDDASYGDMSFACFGDTNSSHFGHANNACFGDENSEYFGNMDIKYFGNKTERRTEMFLGTMTGDDRWYLNKLFCENYDDGNANTMAIREHLAMINFEDGCSNILAITERAAMEFCDWKWFKNVLYLVFIFVVMLMGKYNFIRAADEDNYAEFSDGILGECYGDLVIDSHAISPLRPHQREDVKMDVSFGYTAKSLNATKLQRFQVEDSETMAAEEASDLTIDFTDDPTIGPTADPTIDPTIKPTDDPTTEPTIDPTDDPTTDPTNDPTFDQTMDATFDYAMTHVSHMQTRNDDSTYFVFDPSKKRTEDRNCDILYFMSNNTKLQTKGDDALHFDALSTAASETQAEDENDNIFDFMMTDNAMTQTTFGDDMYFDALSDILHFIKSDKSDKSDHAMTQTTFDNVVCFDFTSTATLDTQAGCKHDNSSYFIMSDKEKTQTMREQFIYSDTFSICTLGLQAEDTKSDAIYCVNETNEALKMRLHDGCSDYYGFTLNASNEHSDCINPVFHLRLFDENCDDLANDKDKDDIVQMTQGFRVRKTMAPEDDLIWFILIGFMFVFVMEMFIGSMCVSMDFILITIGDSIFTLIEAFGFSNWIKHFGLFDAI